MEHIYQALMIVDFYGMAPWARMQNPTMGDLVVLELCHLQNSLILTKSS